MESIIYFFVAVLFSVFGGFSGAFQASTLYWGRLLAGLPTKENINDPVLKARISGESIGNPGLQGGLTTRFHKMRQNFSYIITACLFVSGFLLFKWYVPFLTLLGTLILKFIVQLFLPKSDSEYFKNRILCELNSQRNYFERNGNEFKKEATKNFIDKMNSFTKT